MKVRSGNCDLKVEESCELIYGEIFCANAKTISTLTLGTSTPVFSYMRNKKLMHWHKTHTSAYSYYMITI
jgi:hypothetical protein